ncbi:hypothetical protein NPX13_g8140 [Xylaria arbuscula]|uniref:Uncharacterized protein n=1 Tax=Xylaria arbuscula TaxID=114810 RepID=A0A9W8N8R2_9PEZI|nr:hypothetical protein NPX13_g8140 [Xylaria arbuscula]
MASTFKGALSSLVLDAELMMTTIKTRPWFPNSTDAVHRARVRLSTEARARIACSVWMSRSWTFQEGRLPPTLTIVFRNSMVISGVDYHYDRRIWEWKSPRLFVSEISQPLMETGRIYVEAMHSNGANSFENTQDDQSISFLCECPEIELEKTLYSTFFVKKNYGFVEAWNELSGRSTTKPHDIPLIIANVMDLGNRPLLEYHTSHEMFQAIILTLKEAPLSIFFNTGPRYDQNGHHPNRWVPRDIGATLLTAKPLMRVNPSYFSYQYYPGDKDLSLYAIDKVVSLKSRVYFLSNVDGATYVVGPSISVTDEMKVDDFSATYILIGGMSSPGGNGKRQGACFYLRNTKVSHSSWLGFSEQLPQIDLTYICPLQLEWVETGDQVAQESSNLHTMQAVNNACELRVKYGIALYIAM